MKKYLSMLFIILIVVKLVSVAHAFGFGVCANLNNKFMRRLNVGGGIVVDTNCAGNTIFNI